MLSDAPTAAKYRASVDAIKRRAASPSDRSDSENTSGVTIHFPDNKVQRDKRPSFGRPVSQRLGGGGGSHRRQSSMGLSLPSGLDLADLARSAYAAPPPPTHEASSTSPCLC